MHQGSSEGEEPVGSNSSVAATSGDPNRAVAGSAGAVGGGGTSSGSKKSHSNIYLRGLPESITEEGLLALVNEFGRVQSVRIYFAQKTLTFGAKCTFSFVKFSEVHEAQAAIAALDGAHYAGSTLQARLAVRDVDANTVSAAGQKPPASDNIYCKNLPSSLRDNELRAVFSAYGSVVSCRVLRQGNATGLGGAALVRFASVDAATAAVEALQGSRFPGSLHPLVIRFADSEEMKERKQAERLGLGEGSGSGRGGSLAEGEGAGSREEELEALQQEQEELGQQGSGSGSGLGARQPPQSQAQSHLQQRQQQREREPSAGGRHWQAPVNPYSSLDTRPQDAVGHTPGFVQVSAAQAPSTSNRFPADGFGWHAVPMYMPHGQAGPAYGGGAGGRPADVAAVAVAGGAAELYGRSRGGSMGMSGGSGALQPSMSGEAGEPGMAASGSFLPVRYMAGPHPAYMHVQQMPGSSVGTHPYFSAGPSSTLHGMPQPAWGLQPGSGASGSGTPAGPGALHFPEHMSARALHTVYCSNLPEHADRLYLYECFAPFGAILSIKLLKDKKGNSRRAAFINYADAAGAGRAVAAMNNLPVGSNRYLHVALRNP